MTLINKPIKAVFIMLCTSATILMTSWCIYKYLLDRDITVVTYKRLHESKDNIYPSRNAESVANLKYGFVVPVRVDPAQLPGQPVVGNQYLDSECSTCYAREQRWCASQSGSGGGKYNGLKILRIENIAD